MAASYANAVPCLFNKMTQLDTTLSSPCYEKLKKGKYEPAQFLFVHSLILHQLNNIPFLLPHRQAS